MFNTICFLLASLSSENRLSILNDSLAFGKFDDDGFTNDFEFSSNLINKEKNQKLNFYIRHRMITERGGNRRWDEGNIYITDTLDIFSDNLVKFELEFMGGLSLGGNLGGLALQNSFHHLIHARTIESGKLQTVYDGKDLYAVIIAVDGNLTVSLRKYIDFKAKFMLQAALGGTGLNKAELYNGITFKYESEDFLVNPRLSVGCYEYTLSGLDTNLFMPGGYVPNIILATPEIEMSLYNTNFAIGWSQRFNEGGSQHSIGKLFVQVNTN